MIFRETSPTTSQNREPRPSAVKRSRAKSPSDVRIVPIRRVGIVNGATSNRAPRDPFASAYPPPALLVATNLRSDETDRIVRFPPARLCWGRLPRPSPISSRWSPSSRASRLHTIDNLPADSPRTPLSFSRRALYTLQLCALYFLSITNIACLRGVATYCRMRTTRVRLFQKKNSSPHRLLTAATFVLSFMRRFADLRSR